MTDHTAAEYAEMPVTIIGGDIYFGEEKLPGCIAQNGVVVRPGGADDFNRITVEFIVGSIYVSDPLDDPK